MVGLHNHKSVVLDKVNGHMQWSPLTHSLTLVALADGVQFRARALPGAYGCFIDSLVFIDIIKPSHGGLCMLASTQDPCSAQPASPGAWQMVLAITPQPGGRAKFAANLGTGATSPSRTSKKTPKSTERSLRLGNGTADCSKRHG